jgi:SAM-dependent methyltransferase
MDEPNLPCPPAAANFVGDGDFVRIGENWRRILVTQCGLRPDHRVLDMGCGIGRIALPLTRYLRPPGGYEGLDVVDVGIDWCQKNITPRFPHFRFRLADVYNRGYNPGGRSLASDYRFPYPDGSFDFAILTSVFTHMMPADLDNYLAEVARVLKVGGRCVVTYFLRNAAMLRLCDAGRSRIDFAYRGDGYWTCDPAVPEDAVCYEEADILARYRRCGLAIDGPIRYGTWCGRREGDTGQDFILATKVRAARGRRRGGLLARLVRRLLRGPGPRPDQQVVGHGFTTDAVERARRHVQEHGPLSESA